MVNHNKRSKQMNKKSKVSIIVENKQNLQIRFSTKNRPIEYGKCFGWIVRYDVTPHGEPVIKQSNGLLFKKTIYRWLKKEWDSLESKRNVVNEFHELYNELSSKLPSIFDEYWWGGTEDALYYTDVGSIKNKITAMKARLQMIKDYGIIKTLSLGMHTDTIKRVKKHAPGIDFDHVEYYKCSDGSYIMVNQPYSNGSKSPEYIKGNWVLAPYKTYGMKNSSTYIIRFKPRGLVILPPIKYGDPNITYKEQKVSLTRWEQCEFPYNP